MNKSGQGGIISLPAPLFILACFKKPAGFLSLKVTICPGLNKSPVWNFPSK